jgi:sulfite exporter TauE/SafE
MNQNLQKTNPEIPNAKCCEVTVKNTSRDYLEIGLAAIAVAAIYVLFKALNILPDDLGVTDAMSYWAVLGLGLVAAFSTCMATSGGLLLAVATRHEGASFTPNLYFNLGRLASYAFFGGLIGALGATLTISPVMNGLLIVLVSLVMVGLGLKMLNLFPGLGISLVPASVSGALYEFGKKKSGAFLAGASTFFLPCGFTQALQIYVLGKGGVWFGAATMFVFALGTLPALMSLGAISGFSSGSFKRMFTKMAGIAVLVFGLGNIGNGLNLTGWNTGAASLSAVVGEIAAPSVKVAEGKQTVKMKVVGLEYEPANFTVKKDVAVEWLIDGSGARGCARVIVAPKIGLTTYLKPDGIKRITFTPSVSGFIGFSCSMGMTTPGAGFRVVD